jgi:hypothetical protein
MDNYPLPLNQAQAYLSMQFSALHCLRLGAIFFGIADSFQ